MAAIDLKSRIREIPDWPEPGVGFKDISPLLRDPDALGQAIDDLASWTRENMPPRSILNGYLDRTDVTAESKVQTLGQLAAAVARSRCSMRTRPLS